MDMLRSALRALSQSMSRLSHKQKRGLPSARVMHFSWREEKDERKRGEQRIGERRRRIGGRGEMGEEEGKCKEERKWEE